jgi:hypothetical protein
MNAVRKNDPEVGFLTALDSTSTKFQSLTRGQQNGNLLEYVNLVESSDLTLPVPIPKLLRDKAVDHMRGSCRFEMVPFTVVKSSSSGGSKGPTALIEFDSGEQRFARATETELKQGYRYTALKVRRDGKDSHTIDLLELFGVNHE